MDWLSNLKVGDEVATPYGYLKNEVRIRKVVRLTSASIFLDSEERYNRETGRKVGSEAQGRWGEKTLLIELTPAVRMRVEIQEKLYRVKNMPWASLSLIRLREICAILDAAKEDVR